MLQNRVDPFGAIIKTPARGALMGNRGLLHNDRQELKRPFRLKAWITCLLEFKGRWRPVMSPNQYTELFFLDEATSFAAGHRPCSECRKDAFKKFKACWIKGNDSYRFTMKTLIREIDEIIHQERINSDSSKKTFTMMSSVIPDGCFVLYENKPMVVNEGCMYSWTPFGYDAKTPVPQGLSLTILTPKSIMNAFRSGYVPMIGLHTGTTQ